MLHDHAWFHRVSWFIYSILMPGGVPLVLALVLVHIETMSYRIAGYFRGTQFSWIAGPKLRILFFEDGSNEHIPTVERSQYLM